MQCKFLYLKMFVLLRVIIIACLGNANVYADGWDPTSKASNTISIENTRHNLTQSFLPNPSFMNVGRNQYTEICVYCHTPHGANSQIDAPLWNRTIRPEPFLIYNKNRTLNRPIGQPGANSLTCLSCHDGVTAIDSVINMPGSGGYSKAQETAVNGDFLTTWNAEKGGGGPNGLHMGLGPETDTKCTICHNPTVGEAIGAPDYTVFAIGMDLTNDHPIGIQFPVSFGPEVDFNPTDVQFPGSMAFFDQNNNNYADKNDVRLYDTGEGYEVECASCHDPHGVPIGGAGSEFIPSFLRVSNADVNTKQGNPSGLCLTCHLK